MKDVYTTEQLGPKQALTPEGYLLCEDVPIARTGRQVYAGFELPTLKDGLDGLITVVREEAEVFAPDTIRSFEGKSVTDGHVFVDPNNWKAVSVGTTQNVRRGTGDQVDLLLADLLITDASAIEKVRAIDDEGKPIPGKKPLREVSCGYDAEYEQNGPGVAFQRNIIGNHVALVPRGRAGPRCSIQDGDIPIMAAAEKTKTVPLLQRLMIAIRSGDAALIQRTRDEAEAEMLTADEEEEAAKAAKTADALATLQKTVDGLATTVAMLVKGKTKDEEVDPDDEDPNKKKTEDELAEEEKVQTGDAMRATASSAEILVPGFQMPTSDSVANLAAVTVVRRKVLAEAIKTADGKALVAPLLGAKTVDSLTADAVDTVFVAAAEMAKQRNNAKGSRHSVKTQDFGKAPVSLADINKRNSEFWNSNKQA